MHQDSAAPATLDTEMCELDQSSEFKNVEFRLTPGDEGGWYWEIIRGPDVLVRGVADTELAACREAADAARKSNFRS